MEKSRSWPSAHDWKSCIPQKGIEGSNPSFSANKRHTASAVCLLFLCGGAEDWPSAAPNSDRNYRQLAEQDAKVREFDPPKNNRNLDTGLRLFSFCGIMLLR